MIQVPSCSKHKQSLLISHWKTADRIHNKSKTEELSDPQGANQVLQTWPLSWSGELWSEEPYGSSGLMSDILQVCQLLRRCVCKLPITTWMKRMLAGEKGGVFGHFYRYCLWKPSFVYLLLLQTRPAESLFTHSTSLQLDSTPGFRLWWLYSAVRLE